MLESEHKDKTEQGAGTRTEFTSADRNEKKYQNHHKTPLEQDEQGSKQQQRQDKEVEDKMRGDRTGDCVQQVEKRVTWAESVKDTDWIEVRSRKEKKGKTKID